MFILRLNLQYFKTFKTRVIKPARHLLPQVVLLLHELVQRVGQGRYLAPHRIPFCQRTGNCVETKVFKIKEILATPTEYYVFLVPNPSATWIEKVESHRLSM